MVFMFNFRIHQTLKKNLNLKLHNVVFSGKFEGNDGDGKHVDLACDPHVPGQLHLQLGRAAATEVTEGLT